MNCLLVLTMESIGDKHKYSLQHRNYSQKEINPFNEKSDYGDFKDKRIHPASQLAFKNQKAIKSRSQRPDKCSSVMGNIFIQIYHETKLRNYMKYFR